MNADFERACDELDAAVFTGDGLTDPMQRISFTEYLASWGRVLKEFEKTEDKQNGEE